ncbi:MAG: radical SAM protein [bacterium]|nr:radical SAM protein [bacterium]
MESDSRRGVFSDMKISVCSARPILVPCSLEGFDYQVDPYVGCAHFCRYCYVLDQAETDWTEEILIHADLSSQLSDELEGLEPQTIYMGYLSDPYQPCEAELRQTRTVLEILLARGFSVSILTKSDLVLRDSDILQKMVSASVSVSVAFNDDRIRQLFEANTIETESRIGALRKLKEAGIGTSALVCPVMPNITDPMPLIDALAPHTDAIWVYALSVQGQSPRCWSNVREILSRHFPDIKSDTESAVQDSDHPYWSGLRRDLQEVKRSMGLDLRIHV